MAREFEISGSDVGKRRLMTMRRGVVSAASCIEQKFIAECGEGNFRQAMITLTYRPGAEWSSKDIAKLIKHYREFFRRHGHVFHYVWVLEQTLAGAPHYHIVAWWPKGFKPPLPDKQGWWPHGMTQAVYARSAVAYIAKYASKGSIQAAHALPPKARLWGYGGLSKDEKSPVAFANAPRWLKGLIRPDSSPAKRVVEVARRLRAEVRNAAGQVVISAFYAVERFTAWVCRRGDAEGWWFLSPFTYEGTSADGRMLMSDSGVVEIGAPNGDVFFKQI